MIVLYPIIGGKSIRCHTIDAYEILRGGQYQTEPVENKVMVKSSVPAITDDLDELDDVALREISETEEVPDIDGRWGANTLRDKIRENRANSKPV